MAYRQLKTPNLDPVIYMNGKILYNWCGWCFQAGTLVNMADGSLKNIEDLEVGDEVLNYSGTKTNKVKTVMNRQSETVAIKTNQLPELITTEEHPFWARKFIKG